MQPAHLTSPLNRLMTSRTSSLAQEKSADTAVLPADTSMSAHISDTTECKAGGGGEYKAGGGGETSVTPPPSIRRGCAGRW